MQQELTVYDVRGQWNSNHDRIKAAIWPRDRKLTMSEYERLIGKIRRLTDTQTKREIRDAGLWQEFTNWRALPTPEAKQRARGRGRASRRKAAQRVKGPPGPFVVEAEFYAEMLRMEREHPELIEAVERATAPRGADGVSRPPRSL